MNMFFKYKQKWERMFLKHTFNLKWWNYNLSIQRDYKIFCFQVFSKDVLYKIAINIH